MENEGLNKKLEDEEREKQENEEKEASLTEQIIGKDTRITELEEQVAEFINCKAEMESLRAEKLAAELKMKQDELTRFAELNGLDKEAETVAKAIADANYPALMAEAMKKCNGKPDTKLAPYAVAELNAKHSEYGGLLDSVDQ